VLLTTYAKLHHAATLIIAASAAKCIRDMHAELRSGKRNITGLSIWRLLASSPCSFAAHAGLATCSDAVTLPEKAFKYLARPPGAWTLRQRPARSWLRHSWPARPSR